MSASLFIGCQKATDWKDWPADIPRLVVEPQLDGYRLLAIVDCNGAVHFRHGRPVPDGGLDPVPPMWAEHLGHIAQSIRSSGVRNAMIDGEVMADTHGETVRLFRRRHADMSALIKDKIARTVRYHAFDCVPLDTKPEMRKKPGGRKLVPTIPVPLSARRDLLSKLVARADSKVFRLVPQFTVHSPVQLFELVDNLVDLEFKGAMAKLPGRPYVFGRTSNWLKIKPMRTVEMTITGATVGKGKHRGRLGSLDCVLADGSQVSCGVGFTNDLRERLWAAWQRRPDTLVGKVIEAKAGTAKVPAFFLRLRGHDVSATLQN